MHTNGLRAQGLGWKLTDEGHVSITITRDDWDAILILLGAGMTTIAPVDREARVATLALFNRLNAGNPNWAPYELPKDAEVTHG